MTESYVKSELVRYLRCAFPAAVVIRHEDVATAGVPDISLTYAGNTWWVEVKVARRGKDPTSGVTELQRWMLDRLEAQSRFAGAPHGRALLVIYDDRPTYPAATYIYRPYVYRPEISVTRGRAHWLVADLIRRGHQQP